MKTLVAIIGPPVGQFQILYYQTGLILHDSSQAPCELLHVQPPLRIAGGGASVPTGYDGNVPPPSFSRGRRDGRGDAHQRTIFKWFAAVASSRVSSNSVPGIVFPLFRWGEAGFSRLGQAHGVAQGPVGVPDAVDLLSPVTHRRLQKVARGNDNDLPTFNPLDWAVALNRRK
jgi:hypothetical protein